MKRQSILLFALLASLSDDEFSTQSLCTEWSVQDVAAHVADRLELTDKQRDTIRDILDDSRHEAENLHETMLPQVRELVDRTREFIGDQPLTDDDRLQETLNDLIDDLF